MTIEQMEWHDPRVTRFIHRKEELEEEFEERFDWSERQEHPPAGSRLYAIVEQEELTALCLLVTGNTLEGLSFLDPEVSVATWADPLHYEARPEQLSEFLRYFADTGICSLVTWEDDQGLLFEHGYRPITIPYSSDKRTGDYVLAPFPLYAADDRTVSSVQRQFEHHLQRGELRTVRTAVYTREELRQRIYADSYFPAIPMYDDAGVSYFAGFTYFSPKNLNFYSAPPEATFCVAIASEWKNGRISERIVGVLSVGTYEESGSPYLGITYVDVHANYRRQGIATKLYEQLNAYVSRETVVIGSLLSDQGKSARINETRNRLVTRCAVFDSNAAYQEVRANTEEPA